MTAGGGETSEADDEKLLDDFITNLGAVLEMRASGKFDKEVFDRYNASMVQLSDGHVRETNQAVTPVTLVTTN